MIDYHANGNLMGIYGEGLCAGIHVRNFAFLDRPTEDQGARSAPLPLPIVAGEVAGILEARRSGTSCAPASSAIRRRSPPGSRASSSWTGPTRRSVMPDKGGIALQVHGGGDYTKQFVRYRNIRIKQLDK